MIVAAVVSSPRTNNLRAIAIAAFLAGFLPAAHASTPAAPALQSITQATSEAKPTGYRPPVIRSVGQDQDRQMLGDRSPAEVSSSYQAATIAPTRRPALCAWPIVCATATQPSLPGQLRLDAYAAEIESASAAWGVDAVLVRALIHAESSFNPSARSPKGAQGLMQLMPATAARFSVSDPFDPQQNISGGVQYLAWLLQRFDGDSRLATAAYNAGEGAVDRYGGIPPYRETEQYVNRVQDLTARYRAALGIAVGPASTSAPMLASTLQFP